MKSILWTMSENLGDRWIYGQVEVQSKVAYQLVFEGVIGAGEKSDVAIDDASYYAGPCLGSGEFTFLK